MSMRGLRTLTLVLVFVCLALASFIVYNQVQDHRACVQVMEYLDRPIDTC